MQVQVQEYNKSESSCNLQRFIDVSVGWPVSMRVSRIFRNSSLSQSLQVQSSNKKKLADTAYPFSVYFLVLFKRNLVPDLICNAHSLSPQV